MLQGYRTYIMAGLAVVVGGLRFADVIDQKSFETLMGVIGSGAIVSLRAALGQNAASIRALQASADAVPDARGASRAGSGATPAAPSQPER